MSGGFTTDPDLDIGSGVLIRIHRIDGVPWALTEAHGENYACQGFVRFEGPALEKVYGATLASEMTRWKIESLEPLTLSPSILCRNCGHHGHIVRGKWVPT